MTNRARHTNLIILIAAISSGIAFCEDGVPSVTACMKNGRIVFKIENNTKNIIYIGDPVKCGLNSVEFEATGSRGSGSIIRPLVAAQWKHLVVLTPKGEDRFDFSTYIFVVDHKVIRGDLKKINLDLWCASEEAFKAKTINSLELKHIEARVEQMTTQKNVPKVDNK